MNELPSDVDRLLHAERGNVPTSPQGARERVLARVQATLGSPVAVPLPVVPPTPSIAAAAPGLSGSAKWALALLLGAGVPFGAYLALRSVPTAAPAPLAVVAPAPMAQPPPVGAAPSPPPAAAADSAIAAGGGAAPLHAAVRERHPRARIAPAAAPLLLSPAGAAPDEGEGDGDLAAERALVEAARTALAIGHTGEALALARRHERRFALGQLVEERESIAIRALVSAGQARAARSRAEAFRQRFPHSMFLPAVDAVLQQLEP